MHQHRDFFLQGYHLTHKIRLLQEQLAGLRTQYLGVEQELAAFPLSAAQAQQFLSLQQEFESSSETLLSLFEKLNLILESNIRLRHLDWQAENVDGFANSLTIEGYPLSAALSQKQLVYLFDRFLERLKEYFPPQSVLDVLHGPYSTYKTQLLTGGIHEEVLSPDPTCIVKISW